MCKRSHGTVRRPGVLTAVKRVRSAPWIIVLALLWAACAANLDGHAAEPPRDPAAKPDATVPPDHVQRVRQGTALFKSDVRRILETHCLKCHGGEAVKGDFDLSTRESLMQSGMVGDDAASSQMFAVITHADEPHMPKDADKLPESAIAKIAQWLDLGAPYDRPLIERSAAGDKPSAVTDAERDFWSFRPLADVQPPSVRDSDWARTPIDAFILKELESRKLQPNARADRRTLIRRATFDLLGLPPTPEEVSAFVDDADPDAYAKLIDKLLESPHYGERWARHWMDIARFAESHGYEQDYDRPHAYPYRDFLIQAFNGDMPYNRFVAWQVAGDELAPDNPLAMMATGFLGAGAFPTQLTEAEFESARYDELDDMASTLGTSVLGLSVGCARCHSHKYDPIPAADYYRFIANFTATIRSEIDLDLEPAENARRREQYEQKRRELREALARFEREELPPALQRYVQAYDPGATPADPWSLLTIDEITSSGGTTYRALEDGSWLAQGEPPAKETIVVRGRSPMDLVGAIRLEALTDPSLPHRGPGRAPNGNFALGDIRLFVETDTGERRVALGAARATHQQNEGSLSVAASIDDDPVSGWAVDQGGIGKDQAAVFDLREPMTLAPGARLRCELVCEHPNARHSIGRLRLSVAPRAGLDPKGKADGPDAAVRQALVELKTHWDPSSEAFRVASRWYVRTLPEWQRYHGELEALEKEGPKLVLTKVQVTSEGFPHMKHHADDRGFPHFYPETYFLQRGDVHQKKEVVAPGYLQVLMRDGYATEHWRVTPPEGWTRTRFDRASLANWLTDVEHGAGHLAARVMVNRLWQHHFGRGIVATPNDFGAQGERPTHPELLDWLAADLVAHGWKLKRLHKLIMTSAVYMQSSAFDEGRARIDRDNRFLWRYPPHRLEAEAIRDAMLSVGGMLDTTMYGPGTLDPSMRRRSVYFFIKRSQLIPMMMLFDWPEHLVGIGQRATTTIAPQALAFMNSPQARMCAEGFASRLEQKPEDTRLDYAYALAFGRAPQPRERSALTAFLERQADRYRKAGRQDAEHGALVDMCQALMSMNEFVYID